MLACRQCASYELLANLLFDGTHLRFLLNVDDTDTCTCLAGTSCASASVCVALYIVRQTVVDDVCETVNIESTRRHVGSDEELHSVLAELLHRKVALCLRKFAVERLCVVTVLNEFVGNLLSLHTGAAEDNGVDFRIVVGYSLESVVFVLSRHEVVDVVHLLRALVSRAHYDLLCVAEVVLADALNLLAHCCREEQRVAVVWHSGKDSVDALSESHVEHFVSFIEHHVFHAAEVCHSALHEVDKASWRRHDDLYALLQLANLGFDACTSIYGKHVQPIDIF